MSSSVPRLRMFAGPNGSGKSVFSTILPSKLLGVYINADDLEAQVRKAGQLDLRKYCGMVSDAEIVGFLGHSELLRRSGLTEYLPKITIVNGVLSFREVPFNSYFASVCADLIRRSLMQERTSFTFETVMSFPDKAELLRAARGLGYRTYLYYIATEDPSINVGRVAERVLRGGHDVPEEKIRQRYGRSLDLLWTAIQHSSRAYIFDNSYMEAVWIAEFDQGMGPRMKTTNIPAWFQHAVLNKMN